MWVKPRSHGVSRQLLGEVAVGQPLVVALAPPRAQMHLVDRHRRTQRVDAAGRRLRMRQPCLVEYDGSRARAHFGGERHRIRFQRQLLALRPDDVELVVIAGGGTRHEQLPIAGAAHPHRVPARIPVVEIADHGDPPRIGREHHEGHAVDAVERHRMRAELVVEPLVGAFAKQMKIEIGQDRRKAIGVVEFDHGIAEAGPQLVAPGPVRQRAGEQAGIVNARKLRCLAMFADCLDVRCFGQERAHHVPAALGMKAEIAEGVGVAAFHDRIGLRGQFGHRASLVFADRIRIAPLSGTRSQSGR